MKAVLVTPARSWHARFVTSILAVLLVGSFAVNCHAQYRTANFVVYCQQPAFARQTGDLAEKYRKELAELWLGKELPTWPQPCPITVKFERLAGGETSFAFTPGPDGRSQPIEWRMKLYGSPERILDSVLPHEVTHTIFATHFGRPLPRWADEGACTTVEHVDERKKNHQMLMQFLRSNRGIPFNHMFAMKQYPRDILPLYAQGYSLARYLIQQKGHRHYVNFVGEGMDREVTGREPETWNRVAKKYYGYDDLSDLQVRWLAWVKGGSPNLNNRGLAVNQTEPANPTLIAQAPNRPDAKALAENAASPALPASVAPPRALAAPLELNESESWYVLQSRVGGNATMQRPGNRSMKDQSGYRPGSLRRPESLRNAAVPESYAPPSKLPMPGTSETRWR